MNQTPTPPDPADGWPTPEPTRTLVSEPETLVATPPPLPPPDQPSLDRRIGAGMLIGLAAIGLVALGILIAWLLTHRSDTQTATGTTVVITTTPPTTAPTTAGAAPPSAGAEVVPNLTGLKLADAQAKLSALGLRATTTPVTSSTQPAGMVVDQAPKSGGKLAKGSTVTLSVSTAASSTTATGTVTTTATTTTAAQPQSATVPDVAGQTEASAVQALGQAGILASLAFIPGSDPLGTVLAQAKAAGTTVPYHAHVQINVSRGPGGNPLQQVPNVVGQSLQDAVSTVQGASLRLVYLKFPVTSRAQAGKIVQQSPLSGGTAPQKAQILVFLGAYRPAG